MQKSSVGQVVCTRLYCSRTEPRNTNLVGGSAVKWLRTAATAVPHYQPPSPHANTFEICAQSSPGREIETVAAVRRHFTAAAPLLNSDFWRKLSTFG